MKRGAWLILLLIAYSCGFAQVPGYLGKRVVVGAGLHAWPALLRAERLAEVGLNVRYSFQGEYVLSRAQSIYAQYSLFNTSYEYENDGRTGEASIAADGYEIGFRFYSFQRRGNLAPQGWHQQVGLRFLPYSVKDVDLNFIPGEENLGSFRDFVITYGIGDQRIIHPVLVYYFNLQGGWLLNAFPNQSSLEARQIKSQATGRLRTFSFFHLSMGLGFILG
ncbi:MAG: hypothetical protein AAFY71_08205 [Bacteroidota bacterium]